MVWVVPPKQKSPLQQSYGWFFSSPLNAPIGKELIKLHGSFYSSSKTFKVYPYIRVFELIYIRCSINGRTVTGFCFIVGQMTFQNFVGSWISLGINEWRNVMQICALICLDLSDCHFLTASDSAHIVLCYAKIFCIYVKDLLGQNGLQEWKGNYRQRVVNGIMSRGVKMRKGILIL